MGLPKITLFLPAILATALCLPGSPRILSGESSEELLEVLETRDGKRYRGRVVGYDTESKSYLLQVDQRQIAIPEANILTIRSPSDPGPKVEPEAIQAPEIPGKKIEQIQDSEEASLQSLIREYRKLPSPGKPESLQALEEAAERIRAGSPLTAVDSLQRAIRSEPGCPTAAILLAAIQLDVERNPEAAYPLLLEARARAPDSMALKSLLSRVAGALGYRKLESQMAAEVIRGKFKGPERQYRLFQFFRNRDVESSRAAWKEYRKLDPHWDLLETGESQAMTSARLALQRGDTTEAAGILARLCNENPFLVDEVSPLLSRAFLARAERAQAAGRYEVALGDLQALAEEVPERRSEFEARQREVESAWVKIRLDGVSTVQELETVIAVLSLTIPDLKERFGPVLGKTFNDLAREALPRLGFEESLLALEKGSSYGAVPAEALLDQLALVVTGQIAGGEVEKAHKSLKMLEQAGNRNQSFRPRLSTLRTDLSRAYEKIWSRELKRGNLDAARKALETCLELDPTNREARSRLARIDTDDPEDTGVSSGTGTVNPYLPLREGSWWKYGYGDGSQELRRLTRVETRKNGQTLYRFESNFQIGEAMIPYRKTGYFSGNFFYQSLNARPRGGDPLLKVPVVPGDTWHWRKGDIVCEREYTAVDVRVVTPAGSFSDCLKIKATSRFDSHGTKSRPVIQWFYYSKTVGLVKIEGENPLDGRELVEYSIEGDQKKPTNGVAATTPAPLQKAASLETPEESPSGENSPLFHPNGGLGGAPPDK